MTRAKKADPITVKFLNFIAKDILNNSKILTTINQDLLTRIQSLVANVEVNLDEPLDKDENTLFWTIENHRNT
ncbi:TPA: type II toxin-antitoxin system PrlF family antitoxin [Legionella pneumophila]|uniref:type II toxin-antitoxin system PrlF family antitoxin n=1 Tax=Legionella pneumophila TaxID=446 RepID=UPI000770A4D4|nr:type II toxin-antitoxin system PrlF family antitoxin [Legionella pneumophila]HAT8950054.1 hypothetical protein [Legionella pneumophila subsp. pneumophila]MCO1452549.1 type II toxin-antitoxin system PrlF family antitoxin [Legionella pneumophila]MCZ4723988.1 type II toxin-antitoxin system PrlF family antitoxin [Legionella pneumophila]MCZ4728918.1 type II toxin-antitoxin system PrlF family antitoxin [Legionella pneumophila]MCZ4733740.1 type II toxin-antitoxin system PrlF family antitoxin [Legi